VSWALSRTIHRYEPEAPPRCMERHGAAAMCPRADASDLNASHPRAIMRLAISVLVACFPQLAGIFLSLRAKRAKDETKAYRPGVSGPPGHRPCHDVAACLTETIEVAGGFDAFPLSLATFSSLMRVPRTLSRRPQTAEESLESWTWESLAELKCRRYWARRALSNVLAKAGLVQVWPAPPRGLSFQGSISS
jgi:hypothetical protein